MDGNTLIEWGFKPGPEFKALIEYGADLEAEGLPPEEVREGVTAYLAAYDGPVTLPGLRTNNLPYADFLRPGEGDERDNYIAVTKHMDALMRVPTIKQAAVMPDACPAGNALGTIPVGGVVACENAIHPGFHSADICCSVAISVLNRNVDASRVLDVAAKVSHFGPGGRKDNDAENYRPLLNILDDFEGNSFLNGLQTRALHHFMTQGDGNHFFFVGDWDGRTVIVTHHGSRGLGADLYKRGKSVAERMTRKIANVPDHQSWIPADAEEGKAYWQALQITREWTKLNHYAIHDAVARTLGVRISDWFWNEHNFVFQKTDGLFYHAKGATPAFTCFSPDDIGLTLIPMNMGRGIHVASHNRIENTAAMGFAPHGAGRNMSRGQHMRNLATEYGADSRGLSPNNIAAIIANETQGIDARFWNGKPDLSELPSAYKNPEQIEFEIMEQKLVNDLDLIRPLGSIMAGNDDRDWKAIKAAKRARAAAI